MRSQPPRRSHKPVDGLAAEALSRRARHHRDLGPTSAADPVRAGRHRQPMELAFALEAEPLVRFGSSLSSARLTMSDATDGQSDSTE
jgi:hypothetical protein